MDQQENMFSLYQDVRIVRYNMARIDDPRDECGDMPWQEYHAARNALVRVCKRHGATGPLLECPLVEEPDDPHKLRSWAVGDSDPVYYVVEEQYNDERYLYVDVRAEGVTDAWLSDVMQLLSGMPGWGIAVSNLKEAYVILFPYMLLFTGACFDACKTLRDVIDSWKRQVVW